VRKNGKEACRERTLEDLSKKLREIHLNPRDVEIESKPKVPTKRKMGLRTKPNTKVS
jgi:hypothetical protein